MSNFVNTYLNSPSLLLYQPKVEITDEKPEEHSFLSRKIIINYLIKIQ